MIRVALVLFMLGQAGLCLAGQLGADPPLTVAVHGVSALLLFALAAGREAAGRAPGIATRPPS